MPFRIKQWPWYAIQVRTNRERTANLHLENAGYECFLPTVKCTQRLPDRTKQFEVTLIPGYLFCRMNSHDRLPVLMTPGVIQIAGVGKTPVPIEEEEIAAIQQVTSSGLPAMPWPYLPIGHTVRIAEGPLRGLAGIVVKLKFGFKLVLSVNLLQRSVAVEIDRQWLNAVHPLKAATSQAGSGRLASPPVELSRMESTAERQ